MPQHTKGSRSCPHLDLLAKSIATWLRVITAFKIISQDFIGMQLALSLLGVVQGSFLLRAKNIKMYLLIALNLRKDNTNLQ